MSGVNTARVTATNKQIMNTNQRLTDFTAVSLTHTVSHLHLLTQLAHSLPSLRLTLLPQSVIPISLLTCSDCLSSSLFHSLTQLAHSLPSLRLTLLRQSVIPISLLTCSLYSLTHYTRSLTLTLLTRSLSLYSLTQPANEPACWNWHVKFLLPDCTAVMDIWITTP